MTAKMLEVLKLAQNAERRRQGAAIDIHARTAWALARIGLLEVAGASDGKHYQNGNYVSCFLTDAGRHYDERCGHCGRILDGSIQRCSNDGFCSVEGQPLRQS